MDYATAQQIRKKGLLSSITERLMAGTPIGQSFRESMSESAKAKATGIQQMFDPMNFARVLTGGSRIGPALLGRLTGRKQESIEFFAGGKKNRDPNYTNLGDGSVIPLRVGDSAADVVAKFYRFMKADIDQREKRDTELTKYRKQVDAAKERRINELVSAISTGEDTRGKSSSRKSSLLKFGVLGAIGIGAMMFSEEAFGMLKEFNIKDILSGGDFGGEAGSLDAVKSKEIYDYLTKKKGLSHEHAIGMLANIQAESSFRPGAIGDQGTSGGLFQHHAERFEEMKKFAGPSWQTDWKKQIDFALQEKEGKEYTKQKFTSTGAATEAFTTGFEKPANAWIQSQRRKGNISAIEGVVSGSTAGGPLGVASGLVGMKETDKDDNEKLKSFLASGGHPVDPSKTPWCAAFVGATLQHAGIQDSGSNVATSYSNWGQPVDPMYVQPNDIVVDKKKTHGPGETGGHVGFATGKIEGNRIQILAGNESNKVGYGWVDMDNADVRRAGQMPQLAKSIPQQIPSTYIANQANGGQKLVVVQKNNMNAITNTTHVMPTPKDDTSLLAKKLFGIG